MLPSSWRAWLGAAWIAAGAAAGALSYAFAQSKNLLVFRHAATELVRGHDLYAPWLDFFKYSPTFALLFLPFAHMPAWLAAIAWAALNFGAAFAGIDAVTPDPKKKRTVLLVALAGVLLATDGDQSNLLVAGLMLLAFASIERGRIVLFAVLVAIATHVKLFPIAAGLFVFLHPRPLRSLAVLSAALVAVTALPLVVVSPHVLALEYASWARLVALDHLHRGWCVMTMLEDGLGLRPSKEFVQALGIGMLGVPILASRAPTDASFRRLFAAALLAFSVLFNHRAEYASFVVSAIGVAVWFAEGPPTPLRTTLVAFAVVAHGPLFALPDPSVGGVFTIFAAHRVFHALRVLPLAVIWALMIFDLLYARLFAGVVAGAALGAARPSHVPPSGMGDGDP